MDIITGRAPPPPSKRRDTSRVRVRERGFVMLQKCNVSEYGNSTRNNNNQNTESTKREKVRIHREVNFNWRGSETEPTT